MLKLKTTFVSLALLSAVLASPIPAPGQQLASSGDLPIPGLSTVTGLASGLLDGDGGDDDDDDIAGALFKRQLGSLDSLDYDPLDLIDDILPRQDDDDNSPADLYNYLELIGALPDPAYATDVTFKRQDDSGDDDGDDSGDDNSRREDALAIPFLGGGGGRRYRGGLRGPPEHTGLAGLGDNVGDALTSLGKGLGQLLKRQDDNSDDSGYENVDDSGDGNVRREKAANVQRPGRPRLPVYRGGLRGPPEHTGLAGLGDNLGDALTSIGAGLGQLLKRQDDSGDDLGDDSNDVIISDARKRQDDSGDDSGDDTNDAIISDARKRQDDSGDDSGDDTNDAIISDARKRQDDDGDDSGYESGLYLAN